MSSSAASKKILIVLHQEKSSPGRLGQMLEEKGYTLDIRHPRFGVALPETMEEHKAALIFGGPMSANDPEDYVKQEIDWCQVPLKESAPFLGICLGAQMLVKHLGGDVYFHQEGQVEIGYYPINDETNRCKHHVMPNLPSHFYQWHREGFDLPSDSTRLATGNVFENQAYKINNKPIYGIQFHPELTYHMMRRWLVTASERLKLPGAKTHAEHIEGRLMYDESVKIWLDQFLDEWLASDERK